MVPSDDVAAEGAQAFADRFADEAFADAADVLTADGRTAVVESFPDELQEGEMDATDALEAYWWGLYCQYGEVESVDDVTAAGGEVTVTFEFADATETATLPVADDGLAGLRFSPEWTVPDYVDEGSFTERDVTVDAGDVDLDGVLTIPDGDGPSPGVLLVHGHGLHDPDGTAGHSKILKDLAWGLASRGVAVLRYEKRPNRVDLAPEDHDLDTLVVDDAVAAVDRLRAHDAVAEAAVFVAGHSQGGMCVPRIAERHGGVAGVASLDGPADTALDQEDADAMRYRIEPDGDLDEEQQQALEAEREAIGRLQRGDYDADETILGAPGALWESRYALEPVAAARDLDAAVFAAVTERLDRDLQEPLVETRRENYEGWQAASTGDADRVEYYEDVGHYFQEGPVPVRMTQLYFGGNVAGYVVEDIADWIRETSDT
jgi:dienelactone hydrolase